MSDSMASWRCHWRARDTLPRVVVALSAAFALLAGGALAGVAAEGHFGNATDAECLASIEALDVSKRGAAA